LRPRFSRAVLASSGFPEEFTIMGVHIAGSVLMFLFGVLLIVVGALFHKRDKTSTHSGVVQGMILVLGAVLILSGSGWFWWALGHSSS
jgi:uncharacterized membrane protein